MCSTIDKIYLWILFFNYLECDKTCEECNGDGPDMCLKCAEGYVYQDPVCIGKFHIYKWNKAFDVIIG